MKRLEKISLVVNDKPLNSTFPSFFYDWEANVRLKKIVNIMSEEVAGNGR